MKDEIFEAIAIILGCIVAVVIIWLMFMTAEPQPVDCGKLNKSQRGTSYEPMPKQCMKGV